MPIYEYRCENCGQEFEEWQSITAPTVDTCGHCGGKASRLISQSTFVLKGTGWYVTDYAGKNANNGANGGKKPAANAETKSDAGAGAETKTPEPKSKAAE